MIRADRWLAGILLIMAAAVGLLVLVILIFLLEESWPLLSAGGWLHFLTDAAWSPLQGQYDLLPMLAGSLLVTLLAMLLATPVGIASGIFLRYYAPRVWSSGYRRLLELLSGIPSVVFGFWGLMVLVPLLNQWQPPGASLLAGALVLGLMILPLVALTTDASLGQVPREHWQAAQALGLHRWASIRRVVLPVAMPGILAGAILQTGRALGETMAVLMVTGNVVQFPAGVFDPVRALTSNIALEMAYATGDHRTALFVSGLVLLLATLLLVLLASSLRSRPIHQQSLA